MKRQVQWSLLDNLRRVSYNQNELKIVIYKSLQNNTSLSLAYRLYVGLRLSHTQRNATVTRQRNRCIISGRNWNVLKKTKYSRFVFRNKANFGLLPGVSRMSK